MFLELATEFTLLIFNKPLKRPKLLANLFVRRQAKVRKFFSVGTKKQAKDVIETEAQKADMPYVTNRWLGGMLTNYQTVRASIDRMKKIEELKETEEWNDPRQKGAVLEKKKNSRSLKSLWAEFAT